LDFDVSVSESGDLFDLGFFVIDSNNLFFNGCHVQDLLVDHGYFDDLFSPGLDDLVDLDYNWEDGFDFNDVGDLH
jgi:hypothetical protein